MIHDTQFSRIDSALERTGGLKRASLSLSLSLSLFKWQFFDVHLSLQKADRQAGRRCRDGADTDESNGEVHFEEGSNTYKTWIQIDLTNLY